jgi:hypothetical protein
MMILVGVFHTTLDAPFLNDQNHHQKEIYLTMKVCVETNFQKHIRVKTWLVISE